MDKAIKTVGDLLTNFGIPHDTKNIIVKQCPICKTKYPYTVGTYSDICPNVLKHKKT